MKRILCLAWLGSVFLITAKTVAGNVSVPGGYEVYNPSVSYVIATSSDGKYRGLLDQRTGLWAFGRGKFLDSQSTPALTAGSYVGPNGAIWGPIIRRDSNTSATLFPSETAEAETAGQLVLMDYSEAMVCCNRGPKQPGFPASCPFGAQGSHLPSEAEYRALALQLGYQGPGSYDPFPSGGYDSPPGYNPSQMPDLSPGSYWTSSTFDSANPGEECTRVNEDTGPYDPDDQLAKAFYEPHACVDHVPRAFDFPVFCVR